MADPYTTFTNVRVTGDLDVTGTLDAPASAVSAEDVGVAAYATSGVSAGDLQTVLEALADRIQALEDA